MAKTNFPKNIFSDFPPPPKKKIFPDIKKRQAKIEFCQSLRKTLFHLYGSLPASKAKLRNMIAIFAGFIGPSDSTHLPYFSSDGKAKQKEKTACVAALVSWTIQQGWAYQRGEIEVEEAYAALDKLEQIAEAGLNKCKVEGNPRGYYLEITA